MLDLIRMDLVRMRKMTAFVILPVLFIAYLGIETYALKKTYEMTHDPYEMISTLGLEKEVDRDDIPEDVLRSVMDKIELKVDPFEEYSEMMTSMMPALLIVIFTVLFTNADQASGFVKTIGGQVKRRSYMLFSKLTVIFVFEIYFVAVTFAAKVILDLIMFNGVKFSAVGTFIGFIGVQLLLHFSLVCFVAMATTVTRSNLGGMIIGLTTVLDFYVLLLMLIEKLIRSTFGKKVELIPYLITQNIQKVTLNSTDVVKPLIICGVTALISLALSVLSVEKRDIV